jgi:phospholipid transport system substrate-binding protein
MRRIIVLVVGLVIAGLVHAEDLPPPEKMVAETVRSLASLVGDCRLPLAGDPVALRGVIDQRLRPKGDVLYAGQVILGRYWAEADPDQRRRFAEALYGTLVNRYASGLLLLTDRNVAVVPGPPAARPEEAQVELRIDAGLAAPVPVYLQMRKGSGRWRIYDARWEGQSYVLSLRQAYAQQIRRDGLEAVIRRLEGTAGVRPGPPEERQTAAGRCLRAHLAR